MRVEGTTTATTAFPFDVFSSVTVPSACVVTRRMAPVLVGCRTDEVPLATDGCGRIWKCWVLEISSYVIGQPPVLEVSLESVFPEEGTPLNPASLSPFPL